MKVNKAIPKAQWVSSPGQAWMHDKCPTYWRAVRSGVLANAVTPKPRRYNKIQFRFKQWAEEGP